MEREFEARYPLRIRRGKVTEKMCVKTVLQALDRMRRAPNRVEEIQYFEEIMTQDVRIDEIKKIKENGKKIVGTLCNFVPEELIYASNCIPIRLCSGLYDTISPAEEVLPRDICPLIKSTFGFKMLGTGYLQLCDLVIIPTTCDGKKKLGEILYDSMPVWMLEIPQIKDIQRAKEFWFAEVKRLKGRLEGFTGLKITTERLNQAIQKLHKRQAIFREFYELRKHNPPLINGRDSLLVIQTSFYDDVDRWMIHTEQLCAQLKQRAIYHTPRTTRLLLTGAPIIWPNYKILDIVEEAGATVVADEICSGTQYLYAPVEVDEWTEEAILRAIAYRYLLPSTCPCFIESNDRIDRLLNLIEEFKVDGIIYHSLRLCQLYDIESFRVKQVLKDKGIPMLNLHTDYSLEDVEQIKTRVEAFLEMIKS